MSDWYSRTWVEGKGSAPGTCGELAQGILPDGTNFHVTCPIAMTSSVTLQVRPASSFEVFGLAADQNKMKLALAYSAEVLDLGNLEVQVNWRSDLDVGRGMGSSTADVLAAARALADASGNELSPEMLASIATRIESSDGTMYDGIAVVNQKTGVALRQWKWWPEFVIVMLVPPHQLDTADVTFEDKLALAPQYEQMLSDMDAAVKAQDTKAFAAQATTSARLNLHFVPNPYLQRLESDLPELGAIGANVGHTGTVAGLLYENNEGGNEAARWAHHALESRYRDVRAVVTTTPERRRLEPRSGQSRRRLAAPQPPRLT